MNVPSLWKYMDWALAMPVNDPDVTWERWRNTLLANAVHGAVDATLPAAME